MAKTLSLILEPLLLTLSTATTVSRFWAGWPGRAPARLPDQPVILYEFEGCPFCRIAREAVTELRLPAEIRPCPKNGEHFRPQVQEMGGKSQFPYLIDPNTDTRMYESADVVRYLYRTYGGRMAPVSLFLGPLNALLSSLGLTFRLGSGMSRRGRTGTISEPLDMWGAEGDPRARLLRELLCELELPHIRRPGPGPNGNLVALYDPNTDHAVGGSLAARAYLLERYG